MVIRVEKANKDISIGYIYIYSKERKYWNGRAREEIRVTLWKRLPV